MCSVIEIKNANEYYIHYHSPESMEDSIVSSSNSSSASNDSTENVVNNNKKTGLSSINEESTETVAPASSSSSSSSSSGHQSDDQQQDHVADKVKKKDEEITSDRGSSAGSSTLSSDSETTITNQKQSFPTTTAKTTSSSSNVPITVNSHIPASPVVVVKQEKARREPTQTCDSGTQVDPKIITDEKAKEGGGKTPSKVKKWSYTNGAIAADLRQYLNTRFPKGGVDHELQNTIRDNLYLRTVPVTTRAPRPGEKHGIDYTFLSKEEFIALEKSGELLESGIYDGNHYGTPKPPKDSSSGSPVSRSSPGNNDGNGNNNGNVNFPGAHPSSEGKRKRNRSNVEAMTAKHFQDEKDEFQQQQQQQQQQQNGTNQDTQSNSTTTTKSILGPGPPGGTTPADSGHPDSPDVPQESDESSLGPLPPNWEKAYTDKGEPYFIDHNSGTSHWLDPRLSRIQKKRPEDCSEDELPFGWERIDDPHYGTYYIDHVNRRTQYENPVLVAKAVNQSADAIMAPGEVSTPPVPPGPPGPGTFPRTKKTQSPFFTRDPNQLRGERIRTQLVKSSRGLGFTIVGGDDNVEEFLQIKSVVPNGPAWVDGSLKTGDVLVYVNTTCVLGFTHHDMVTMFQAISSGEVVNLEVCRGYPLPFDPDDPNTEIVTTVAVTSPEQGDWAQELEQLQRGTGNVDVQSMPDLSSAVTNPGMNPTISANRPGSADLLGSGNYADYYNNVENSSEFSTEVAKMTATTTNGDDIMSIPITKGGMGFGFTIADSAYGQKVKKILDRPRCKNLNEGDVLIAINNINVRNMSHTDVVQVLKDCTRGAEAIITVQRGLLLNSNSSSNSSPSKKYKKDLKPKSGFLFRSKTPTAELCSTQEKEIVPTRPKTPLVDTRNMMIRSKTPTSLLNENSNNPNNPASSPFQRNDITRASVGGYQQPQPQQQQQPQQQSNYMNHLSDQMGGINIGGAAESEYHRAQSPGRELDYFQQQQQQGGYQQQYQQQQQQANYINGYQDYNNVDYYQQQQQQQQMSPGKYGGGFNGYNGYGMDPRYGYAKGGGAATQQPGYRPSTANAAPISGGGVGGSGGSLPRGRKESTSFEHSEPLPGNLTRWPRPERRPTDMIEITVTLHRQDSGFGFRIVGGTEEGSQVSIGHIVPGGAADLDGRLFSGDEIVAVDNTSVLNSSHHQVVGLMGNAAQNGRVTLTIRRRIYQQDGYGRGTETYPYDVTVDRRENEGFGFVIISSVSRSGSTIGRIIPGSPAERCGRLHVGDRILAVNHVDINYMHHGEIVNLIKDSGYSVVLSVGPPIDDTSSTASTSHRSSTSSMVTAQAMPTVLPPTDSTGSTVSVTSNQLLNPPDSRSVTAGYQSSYGSQFHPQQQQQQQQRQQQLQQQLVAQVQQQQQQMAEQQQQQQQYDPYKGLTVAGQMESNNYHQDQDQELNMLELDDQYYAVELTRGPRGFGFSIRGGREFQSMPLFVLRIAVDGPAAADGRLRVGDQIIEINGINTKNMTHSEAIELIKSGGTAVRLLVRRGKMPPAALMEQLSPLSPTPIPTMVQQPGLGVPSSSSAASVVGVPTSVPVGVGGAASRPMSAMSQPMMSTTTQHFNGNIPGGNYDNNGYNGYASGYLPNGHLINGPVSHSSPRDQYYQHWSQQQQQQQHQHQQRQ